MPAPALSEAQRVVAEPDPDALALLWSTGELRSVALLTLALQSGRIRALYGPGGEQALLRLYRKLPGGVELARSAAAVGEALSGLQGRALESVSLTAVGPGAFSLTVAAGGVQLKVHLDRQGARLASVEA